MGNSHVNVPVKVFYIELNHEDAPEDVLNHIFYYDEYPMSKYVYHHGFEDNVIKIAIYDKKTYVAPIY